MTDRMPLVGRFLYEAGDFLFRGAFTLGWRLRIVGRENIPRAGGVLFASNHVSLADPPLVGCCIPRTIHFMAKQELFEVPLLGWFIRQVNAFPIKRMERDLGAFRTAQRILENGGGLIVFPEGTRQKRGRLGAPKLGAAMLAHKSGCPVIPVYVHNTDKLASFARLTVCFGPPLHPDAAEADYEAFSRRIMASIAQLKEEHLGHGA